MKRCSTVDVERFAGLNFHSFNPTGVLVEILLHCLGQRCLLFSIIKKGAYIHRKTFAAPLKTVKTTKV